MFFGFIFNNARYRLEVFHFAHRSFYDARTKLDTIFAPATSINLTKGSPLGVIRVSGPEAERVLNKFTGFNVSRENIDSQNSRLQNQARKCITTRRATFTRITQPDTGELIDKGLVLWFSRPHSYTGEDVCEFHLHGSQAIMKTMLDSMGTLAGLRPAEAGEFTRRAVYNGKLSLPQAESLPDLIASKTDNQRRLALKGLDGATLDRYESWIKSLVNILAHLEASIDFGEDELIGEHRVVQDCVLKLCQLSREIENFIKFSSRSREVIQSGVIAAILGKPNSGKSTFMNVLCQRDKSIVSDLSGTTRDVVEHSFELGGHAMTLCDTAGLKQFTSQSCAGNLNERDLIRKHDIVEREGIRRALDAARKADLIFYLIDGTTFSGSEVERQDFIDEFERVLKIIDQGKPKAKMLYLIINKMDLNEKFNKDELDDFLGGLQSATNSKLVTTFISCKTKLNLDRLVAQVSSGLDMFASDDPNLALNDRWFSTEDHERRQQHGVQQFDYVNERHLSLLKSTHRHLFEASKLSLITIDKMAQHVRESVDYLSRIVGSVSNDEVIDVIFRDFCIGK